MKKNEVIHYLINEELIKRKNSSSLSDQEIERIEEKMQTKGTHEYNLYELYCMYYEEESNNIRLDIGKRILKLVPNDYDILSDEIYYSSLSTVEKIKALEELEQKQIKDLLDKEFDFYGKDDFYLSIEGREYLRLLDKLSACYLYINKKEEYIQIAEKILLLNPEDSLNILDNLSLVYFNKKEYRKIQDLYGKHQDNLILQTLDYAIKFYDGQNVKKEIESLLLRNHYIVYYFSNYLEIRQKALDKVVDINSFPLGSLEETMLALIAIEDVLDNEALELYMKAFLMYNGDEIVDFLSEDELNMMLMIFDENAIEKKDPTKARMFKVIAEQKKKAIIDDKKFIPNDDRNFINTMLDKMVEKHLIEIYNTRISLTLGGMMHIYTIMKFNNQSDDEEDLLEEETNNLIS